LAALGDTQRSHQFGESILAAVSVRVRDFILRGVARLGL
jgi:hypothetical protein